MIKNTKPIYINTNIINIQVDSQIVKGYIDSIKSDIYKWIIEHAAVEGLQIQLIVLQNPELDKKIIKNSRERFWDMEERNPHLKTLREKLNLELDI